MPSAPDTAKRSRGAYFTTGNPFTHPAFTEWLAGVGAGKRFLEPFAGAGDIPRLMAEAGHGRPFDLYDISPAGADVVERDTLASFPAGYAACVTNPPYLSLHVARRRGIAVDAAVYGAHQSLYQVALERCLEHCSHVAAIIPESFATAGALMERCCDLVRCGPGMFQDTHLPVCLALFGPETGVQTRVWDRGDPLGVLAELAVAPVGCACTSRISFNDEAGQLGLRAVDSTAGADLGFVAAAAIPAARVNRASRLITRVRVDDLATDPGELAAVANTVIGDWRAATADTCLTAFTSHRRDGRARRRLDYKNARALLADALCRLEPDPRCPRERPGP